MSRINGLSITYENKDIIHCCAQLDEVQLITTINEMAAERGLTEIDIYSMSYTEFKEAYEEYVNQ